MLQEISNKFQLAGVPYTATLLIQGSLQKIKGLEKASEGQVSQGREQKGAGANSKK
jgi:hypothetical protein